MRRRPPMLLSKSSDDINDTKIRKKILRLVTGDYKSDNTGETSGIVGAWGCYQGVVYPECVNTLERTISNEVITLVSVCCFDVMSRRSQLQVDVTTHRIYKTFDELKASKYFLLDKETPKRKIMQQIYIR